MNPYTKRVLMIGRVVDNLDSPTEKQCSKLSAQLSELQSDLVDSGLEPHVNESLLRSVRCYQEYLSLHCPKGALT